MQELLSRHQCVIYGDAPSRHLPSLAAVCSKRLAQGYRCLYLNSPPMVAGMRSSLAALGIDVAREVSKFSLVATSEQNHLVDGHFEVKRMMNTLASALERALEDGYAGLWASGDMTWELGPDKDFSKLLEYETLLEQFLLEHPEIPGICQYHATTMPRESICHGLFTHRSLFINDTLSVENHYYRHIVAT